MSLTDAEGNRIKEGDWVGFTVPGMAKGQILAAVEGGISLAGSNQVTPGFVSVVLQVPADAHGRLGMSKIYGPQQNEPGIES